MRKLLLILATISVATSCTKATKTEAEAATEDVQSVSEYVYSRQGVGPIQSGIDISKVETSCPGLYDRVELSVACYSEDGEGASLRFYSGDDLVIEAPIKLSEKDTEALGETDMICESFPMTSGRLYDWLVAHKSTKIDYAWLAGPCNVVVEIGGNKYPISSPMRDFMAIDGAKAEATLAEGIWVDITVGDVIIRSNDCLNEEAEARLNEVFEQKMSDFDYSPVPITISDLTSDGKSTMIFFSDPQ